MTEEQQEVVAEIVEELKTPRRKRRTKAEIEAAKAEKGTAIVPAKDDYKTELQTLEAEAKDQLEVMALCEIESQEDMDQMGQIQREAFERWKKMEDKRKYLKELPLEQCRRIDNEFKPIQGFLKAIEKAAQEKIAAFRKLAAEAQDRALAAVAESGGVADRDTLVVAHGANVLQLPSQSREVVKWVGRVVQPQLLPEKYWRRIVNLELIQAEVEALGGDADIPGVCVERQVTIVNKAVRG
jgi:hypothetical protein